MAKLIGLHCLLTKGLLAVYPIITSTIHFHFFSLTVIAKFSYHREVLNNNRPIRQDRNTHEDKNIESSVQVSRISDGENGRRIRRIDVLQELSRIE